MKTVEQPRGSDDRVRQTDRATHFDVAQVRAQFPILSQRIHGKPLVYLDNAATTQKPQLVLDALRHFYECDNSNVHRGVHLLSERATRAYEEARVKVKRFLRAADAHEIIFVRGTTEAINLVASTFGRQRVSHGDDVLISAMEHHSNIVPWQMLCEQAGAQLRVVPITDAGEIDFDQYRKLLGPRTRLVALSHVSNALGTVNPVREAVAHAHERGIPVLLDGAQAVPHLPVDVHSLDCDFYVFSAHKVYGPTGIGVLYGKAQHLNAMPPYQGGGDMIASVTFEKTVYNQIPYKFEAGTPNVAGAVGLGAGLDFLEQLGPSAVATHEQQLLGYAVSGLSSMEGVRLIGTPRHRSGAISFVIEGIHPHDIGTILDQEGVAIRTGHHCAQPVMDRFDVPATARASLGCYNTREDIDALLAGIEKVREVFG